MPPTHLLYFSISYPHIILVFAIKLRSGSEIANAKNEELKKEQTKSGKRSSQSGRKPETGSRGQLLLPWEMTGRVEWLHFAMVTQNGRQCRAKRARGRSAARLDSCAGLKS
ncbi:hypothetical protein EVAR_93947_1 [Eumeta japonica]|uniref:Uncharacterized protein n=1 Tax=Eumeta variegata TaxID=151549 RepID=A0A4C1TP73_EUMVA|nr:hypothetical protein EVAR_93947_1 [Eumeta japonica]